MSAKPHPAQLLTLPTFILLLIFAASGFAALAYQVVWQRALFAITGTDLGSTTIVVSLFMFGLGMGALLGGQLADRFPNSRILIFSIIEVGIGLYGIGSLKIIALVAATTHISGFLATVYHSALALLFPTILMGATLPLLIVHLYKSELNIGISTGKLYSANTLGGAVGAAIVGFVLFYETGLRGTVAVAASINFLVAISAFYLWWKSKNA